MSRIIVVVIGLVNLLGEATWLHRVAIFDIVPNLSMILIVFWGILQGGEHGRRLGLVVGLLQDILFCRVIGFYGLVYYLIGHISGFFNRDFDKRHFILSLTVVAAADLAYGILHYLIYCFFQGNLDIGYYFMRRVLPEVCYTALISVPLYPLARLLSRAINGIDRWLQSGKDKER